jgi:hypothetical protein
MGLALYLAVGAPVIIAVLTVPIFKRSQPGWFIAIAVITAVGTISQAVIFLVNLLVIAPRTRASATYTVTDRRVMVTAGLRSHTTSSAYISTLPPPSISEHGDGTSTVRFRDGRRNASRAPMQPMRREAPTFTLPALSNADAAVVLAAIQQARHASPGNDAIVTWLEAASSSAPPESAVPTGWAPAPGERVLWLGRPGRVRWWYGAGDLFTSFLGIFLIAFAIVMEPLAISSHAWPVAVFVLLFVAFGVHLIIGRVLWRRARIRRSTYLVTTQRVATVWNLRHPRVVSAPLTHLHPLELSNDGTLTFTGPPNPTEPPAPTKTTPPPRRRSGQGSIATLLSPAATSEAPVFLDLADAVTVYRLVGALQAAAPSITAKLPT